MKKTLTLLTSAIFMLATFVACNNNDEYTAETPGTPDVSVTGVSLNPATASLLIGDTLVLTATISPENATNQNVTWQSSNTTVATVLNSVITAIAEGTATITVTTADGNRTATTAVTVTTAIIPVASVSLNETTATLEIGETLTLTATVLPENATNQNITWTSSDNAIATVENGVVTAISDGTATITVTTADGNRTATATVTVTTAIIPVASVSLNETTATLEIGETLTLTATVLPENATSRNITWTSSDNAIATVENGVVTAISDGTATITVTTTDGNRTATCVVTVTPPPLPMTGCNANIPGWGESLGTISWGTIGNTSIETNTTSITGTNGRPNQVWSGTVFASACQTKTTFNGGTTDDFNADCRRSQTELTGHFFSWCAVMRFADQFCPYPWRVPTTQDFTNLHQSLGFTLPERGDNVAHGNAGDFMPTTGTGFNPQIGGTWGGSRFTGWSGDITSAGSNYWSQTEYTATTSLNLAFDATNIWPQRAGNKALGLSLRCVRN